MDIWQVHLSVQKGVKRKQLWGQVSYKEIQDKAEWKHLAKIGKDRIISNNN